MLYPTLEDGHKVLGKEFCSGYVDAAKGWNTGFYCPSLIPDVPVYCCGTEFLKYCCTLGKPIQGGHYSKGYDIQPPSNSGYEEESESPYEEDSTDIITHDSSNQAYDENPVSDKTLIIGIICGLVTIAALMAVVSCLYCSCCILYKKRRRLDGTLLYGGIQPSSTTCGLLNSLGSGIPSNSSGATNVNNLSGRNHDVVLLGGNPPVSGNLPNYVGSTTRLNPLPDYWNGGSSNSSSCGRTTSGGSSGGVAPTDASIFHFNITESSQDRSVSFGISSRGPIPHLEPPPPYLAAVGQSSGHAASESIAAGVGLHVSRTPQRTSSVCSSSTRAYPHTDATQRHLALLPNPDSNTNTNPLLCRMTSENIHNSNNPMSENCRHGSDSVSSNIPVNTPNALTRLLSSANRGRSNLPPPYFVEQYRIRNRVRPPPGESQARQNLQNLLYPLLNSSAIPGSSRTQRRRHTSTDTQSEPHRVHQSNRRDNSSITPDGTGRNILLHRSSSDRQQNACTNLSRETSRRTIPRSTRSERSAEAHSVPTRNPCSTTLNANRMRLLENMEKILNTQQLHEAGTRRIPQFSSRPETDPTPSTSAFRSVLDQRNGSGEPQRPMIVDSVAFHTTAHPPNRNETTETSVAQGSNSDGNEIAIITGVNAGRSNNDGTINSSEDEEDEIIAVVTTFPIHQSVGGTFEGKHDIRVEYPHDQQEDYVEDESSEENSPGKLSESAPNSSGTGSNDRSHIHYIQAGEKTGQTLVDNHPSGSSDEQSDITVKQQDLNT